MHAVRCGKCNKLLARAAGIGTLEIKCPRCRFINKLERPRAPFTPKGEIARGQTLSPMDRR